MSETIDAHGRELELLTLETIADRLAAIGDRLNPTHGPLGTPRVVKITANKPTEWEHDGPPFESVVVSNSGNAFSVYVGLGGGDGTAEDAMLEVPANCYACIPVRAQHLSIGAGANAGSVYVLPFETAQPFSASKLA